LFQIIIERSVIPKIKKMILYWDQVEIIREMHEVIEEFKALGSHKDRIKYEDDITLIQFIYNLMLKIIKGESPPKEFWDQLIELVHNKTEVKDFRTLYNYEIGKQDLVQVYGIIRTKPPSIEEVADALRILRSFLLDELANPVYRVIYERLEEVRKDWIRRHDDSEFAEKIKELLGETVEYKKETEGLSFIDFISKTVTSYFKNEVKDQNLNLENFKKAIREVADRKIIGENEKKNIMTNLLKDLFKEVKNVDRTRLKDFAEEMTEFVINELKRKQKSIEQV